MTATGLVSAAGDTADALFGRLLEGRPLAPAAEPGASPGTALPALRIVGFDPRSYVSRKGLGQLSRTSQLAVAAASRIRGGLATLQPAEVGVVFGSAWASLDSVVRFEREAQLEGLRFVDPILFTETVANVPAGQLSIHFGWSALNATVACGSASGSEALREAVRFLDEGRAAALVAGGGDELNLHLLRTLQAEGLVAGSPSGLIGSEGACVLVIEPAARARERGARVLGRLVAGAGRAVILGHAESGPVTAAVLGELLDRAGLEPREVDLLVLSGNGNGSGAGDCAEAEGVAAVFGAVPPPMVAPKAVLGECWGAAGPLGVVVALEAMRRGTVPPRPRGFEPGGSCNGLNLPAEPLECNLERAVVLAGAGSPQVSALLVARGD